MTGQDLVNALQKSDLLDKEIVGAESDDEGNVTITIEESSKYVGDDEVEFTDFHITISKDGKWRSERVTWIG